MERNTESERKKSNREKKRTRVIEKVKEGNNKRKKREM